MHRRLKIGFLPSLTLVDKLSSWNITNGYMAQVLEKYCGDLTYIEPIDIPELLLGKVFNKATQLLLKKNFMYYHSFFMAKKYAKLLTRQLSDTNFDVIFAPACASETAFLRI